MSGRSRAVVVGAGISGLLAARVLAGKMDEVILLERDAELPDAVSRPGVPQGNHLHVLLKRGQEILNLLFPDLDQALGAHGAPAIDWGWDTAWLNPFGWVPRFRTEIVTRSFSRPLLESCLRDRVLRLPGVSFFRGHTAIGLLSRGRRIVGVETRGTDGLRRKWEADLVVEATGRESLWPRWLAAQGFGAPPPPQKLDARLGYASRRYRLPAAQARGWRQLYIQMAPPVFPRGGVICPIENEEFIVTLVGGGGDYPPSEETAFLEFARSLRSPLLHQTLCSGEPIGAIHTYRRTANSWLAAQTMPDWPEGLVAMGDTVCSLNPVYGQGMTVCALSAEILGRFIGERKRGWEKKFQGALARSLAHPWMMATSEDRKFEPQGATPAWGERFRRSYFSRVLRGATRHAPVHHAFLQVLHLLRSPLALFEPGVAWSCLKESS